MSKQELEQLDYEDVLVNLNSNFEQYGVRQVMMDFRDNYPQMFAELLVQIDRLKNNEQIPALFKPAC